MAKDPAFLFYSQDFIVGVQTMNFEDRGRYITLLTQMHQQGRMDEETIRFLVGSVSDKLRLKFKVDEKGFWYNERLEIETEKRKNFTESRRNNGLNGGRPKKGTLKTKPNVKANENHMDNHMENENEDCKLKLKREKGNEVLAQKKAKEPPLVFPYSSDEFQLKWECFMQMPKQKKKLNISKQMMLNKLSEFDETFSIQLIEQAIANNWQGLTFDNTKEKYQDYLNNKKTHGGKQQTNEQKRNELNALADLACQVVSAIDSQNR